MRGAGTEEKSCVRGSTPKAGVAEGGSGDLDSKEDMDMRNASVHQNWFVSKTIKWLNASFVVVIK